MRRQLHAGRRQGIDGGAEPGQRIDEGMNGAAAFEVAGDRDLHVLEALVLRTQREQVAQRLRRVLVAAVAAIDHRDRRVFGGKPGGAVARMTDDDDIGVIADDADGVGEAFALGGGAHRRIGAGDVGAAEPQHGALERQPGARRRLVEQARQDELGRDVGAAADPVGDILVRQFLQKPLRDLEDRLDLHIGEIVDGDDDGASAAGVSSLKRCYRPNSSGPASPLRPAGGRSHYGSQPAQRRATMPVATYREANRHDHESRASTPMRFSTSHRLTKTSICFRAIRR